MATGTLEKFSSKMIISFLQRITPEEVKKKLGIQEIQQDDIENGLYQPVNLRDLDSGVKFDSTIDISLYAFICRLMGFNNLPDYIIRDLLNNPETLKQIQALAEGIYVDYTQATNIYAAETMQFFIKSQPILVEA